MLSKDTEFVDWATPKEKKKLIKMMTVNYKPIHNRYTVLHPMMFIK